MLKAKFEQRNRIPMTLSWVNKHPLHWLASAGGLGCFGNGAGTLGSLAGAVLFVVLLPLIGHVGTLVVFLVLLVLGAFAAQKADNDLGVHDHGGVVIDEVVAIGLMYAFLPPGALSWVLGFVAFRVFDIVKPAPIAQLDARLQNGWGVMLDDLVAALYAWLVTFFVVWLLS